MPLCETMLDGGGRMRYLHSSAIYPERGMTWCLSYVTTKEANFADLEAQPGVVRIFDEMLTDEPNGASAPRARSTDWLREKHGTNVAALNARLGEVGADGSSINANSSRSDVLKILGQAAGNNDAREANFHPEAWHTGHGAS